MKRIFLALVLSILILTACGPHESFYLVTFKSKAIWTCNTIKWEHDYLYCDSKSPVHYTKIAAVEFKAAK